MSGDTSGRTIYAKGMYPTRLLLTEDFFADFPSEIKHALGADDINARYIPADQVTRDDLMWADSWSGFRYPASPLESNIRWYHSGSDGVDQFHNIFSEMREVGAILTNTVGTMPHRIAEYVVAVVLSHVRRFEDYRQQQERRQWKPLGSASAMELTVTVVGTGRIGSEIATLLRPFVSSIHGLSLSGREKEAFDTVTTLEAGAEVLGASDVVVAVLPRTPETGGLLDADFFNKLSGALFVNVGRGITVDHEGLRGALESGCVLQAVLDVFEKEPLDDDDWRWSHPQITVTAHGSGITRKSDAFGDLVANLKALRANEEPPNLISLDGWY